MSGSSSPPSTTQFHQSNCPRMSSAGVSSASTAQWTPCPFLRNLAINLHKNPQRAELQVGIQVGKNQSELPRWEPLVPFQSPSAPGSEPGRSPHWLLQERQRRPGRSRLWAQKCGGSHPHACTSSGSRDKAMPRPPQGKCASPAGVISLPKQERPRLSVGYDPQREFCGSAEGELAWWRVWG